MTNRPWLLLTHVPYEGPGLLRAVLGRAGVELAQVRLFAGEAVPTPDDLSWYGGVLAMGGPMNALDDKGHPYLAAERALLARAAESGRAVLGICLGAQLLAAGLGARIRRLPRPEIGLGTVTLTAEGLADPALARAGGRPPVVHWHADSADPPDGSVVLASTRACPNQAFRWGRRAYGLQFHLELTPDTVRSAGPHLPPALVREAEQWAGHRRAWEAILTPLVAELTAG